MVATGLPLKRYEALYNANAAILERPIENLNRTDSLHLLVVYTWRLGVQRPAFRMQHKQIREVGKGIVALRDLLPDLSPRQDRERTSVEIRRQRPTSPMLRFESGLVS